MQYYETMYIVHPALESGRLKDLILSIESNLVDLGGKTCTIEVWGKKKLAYPINKEKYGMYVLLQFESDGSKNKEFNLNLDHNINILGYLTTKISDDQLLSDIPSLEQQLGLLNSGDSDTSSQLAKSNEKIAKTEDSKEETVEAEDSKEETVEVEDSKEETVEVEDLKEETVEVEDSKEEAVEAEDSKEEIKKEED